MLNFNSLSDLMKAIPDERSARELMEKIIWTDGPVCPHCYNVGGYKLKDQKTYKCKSNTCKRTFTVTVKTIFEKTYVPLSKWICAIYLCCIHKRGISSIQLASDIEVTQKTAWFMLHRIRKLFLDKAHDLLSGIVEIDETFVGGKNKNRHWDKKAPKSMGRAFVDKTPVVGMLERGGRLVAVTAASTNMLSLTPIVKKNILRDSVIYTDEWKGYNDLHLHYHHEKVYHSNYQYINGSATTNGIENFWSHLKRGIFGTFYWVSRKHLQRYVDEFVFKFNVRNLPTKEKMCLALVNCRSRLKFRDLVSSSP